MKKPIFILAMLLVASSFIRMGNEDVKTRYEIRVSEGDIINVEYVGEDDFSFRVKRNNDWLIETVDSVGDLGGYTSLALDSNCRPRMSYYSSTNKEVKYAVYSEDSWQIEVLDSVGYWGGHTSLSIDSLDKSYLCYHDDYEDDALKYAHYDGNQWITKIVDVESGPGKYTSMALNSLNQPHISYSSGSSRNLKHAFFNGNQWQIGVVDSSGDVGKGTSIALDLSGLPHISYTDYGNNYLKYARNDGNQWHIEIIDPTTEVRFDTALALNSQDIPYICYLDTNNQKLKLAYLDGDQWHIDVVDPMTSVTMDVSITFDKEDILHISYHDNTNDDLKYAQFDGIQWTMETVDSPGNVGYETSISIDNKGLPHISYVDASNEMLKYAMMLEKEPPLSSIEPINPFWIREQSLPLTVAATDLISGVRDVELWYRYSDDNTTWQDWTLLEKTETSPYLFDFTFPDGNGYYEFYSTATDAHGNTEMNPEIDVVRCGYDTMKPTANAGLDSVVTIGGTLFLDASESWDNLGIMKYTWYFDDEEPHILYGINPNYTFDDVGIFEITLEVVDWAGFRDIDTVSVTVYDDVSPLADAGDDQTVNQGDIVFLDGGNSRDNIGITAYSWTFVYDGEEINVSGVTAKFRFDVPGIYEIILTVTDGANNSARDRFNLTVIDITLPEAKAAMNGTVIEPGAKYRTEVNTIVFLDASASTDNVGIVNYTWEIMVNNSQEKMMGEEVECIFGEPGTYRVTLRVGDVEGNMEELSFDVVVNESDDGKPDGGDTPGNGGGVLVELVVVIVVLLVVILGMMVVILLAFRRKRMDLNENSELRPPSM